VRSSTGLGIGLYQAARLAEKSGYELRLAENRDGAVCFALRRAGGGLQRATQVSATNAEAHAHLCKRVFDQR